jgi:LPS O-antigen subunit length determinant protein (WzzB/FepE family)
MKKNLQHRNNINDEIDLNELTNILWKGRIKIALIIIVSVLLSYGFNKTQPNTINSYQYSLGIKPSRSVEFIKLEPILNFLGVYTENTKDRIFDKFLKEIMDYEELITILKGNEEIQKSISQLSKSDRQQKLFGYAKIFTIEPPTNEEVPHHLLKLIWHDEKQSRNIIEQILNLTIVNFQNSFFDELEQILDMRKNDAIYADNKRIEYLLEQSLIAKELDLADNTVDSVNLSQSNSNVQFNFTPNDVAYYLRGYKAIGKEISLIKARDYNDFDYYKNQLNSLKNNNFQWIDYNIFLLNSKLFSKPKVLKINLALSIMIGLVIGVFYVYFFNKFKSRKNN